MLFLAKAGGIAVLVWFFLTAKKQNQPAFQWAIIGLIGYWVTWWLVKLTFLTAVAGLVAKNMTAMFVVTQIPALCAIAAAYFIRKKLLADAAKLASSV